MILSAPATAPCGENCCPGGIRTPTCDVRCLGSLQRSVVRTIEELKKRKLRYGDEINFGHHYNIKTVN